MKKSRLYFILQIGGWSVYIILYIFIVEIAVKMLALGKKPWLFFTDAWNIFDFLNLIKKNRLLKAN